MQFSRQEGLTMPETFGNPEETKVEDETASNSSAKTRIEKVADKAAAKPGKTEKKYDKDKNIFTI
jgi:hypothetical protein